MNHEVELSGLMAAIVASSRVRAASISRATEADMERRASARRPRSAAFEQALSRAGCVNVIAECKRRSPLKGVLCKDYDPAEIAMAYERSGAAAVSVLTEPEFFDGSLDDLHAVAASVSLPVLRKDFIVDERQLVEARAAGADAVLLIVAALSGGDLRRLLRAAHALELAALVEVHTMPQLQRALDAGAKVIGVNARDLRTMTISVTAVDEIGARIPEGVVRVAESGITSRAAIDRLRLAGFQAFLIGERLMKSGCPGDELAGLVAGEAPCS